MADQKKYMTTREACDLAISVGIERTTIATISEWAIKYGFGRKIAGRYRIDRKKFTEFLHGDDQWKTEPGTEPADEGQRQPNQQRRDW